ncbi:MAG: serine hydrolase domain-containing protein, partial [Streptosporangiaceae bacterium]
MHGFPPPVDALVTLANWQEPPYNRWSFSHMRELVPTQRISKGLGPVTPLLAAPLPLGEIALHRVDGAEAIVDDVLDSTYTDAVVVVHGGRVVLERYAGETGPDTPHLLMSISKSVVGCVAGNLVERGLLSPAHLVTDHVPELERSGYRGASLRDVLDMRSGVEFSEDY